MDMMAMAVLFDLLSKNRRWDADFEPRPQSRMKRLARRLFFRAHAQTGICSDELASCGRHQE